MRRLLAVTARELRERWLLFPASLVFGLNPLVFPAFGLDRQLMPLVGVVTAFGLAAAAAVIMGSTMLARDTANGRLGFLLSRPLSWPTVWGGKWLAALILVAGSGALAAIPFMAAYPPESHHGSWPRTLAHQPGLAFVLAALMLAVGFANLLATAYRSRSPWFVVDLLALVAAIWAVGRCVAPLLLIGEGNIWLAAAPLALGLLAGSATQVALGRTDLRRAHRALSATFWAIVFVALAAAAGWLGWIEAAGPADLRSYGVVEDANGRWLYVEGEIGRARGYGSGYLLDTGTGDYLQTTPALSSVGQEAFWGRLGAFSQQLSSSADGRFAGYWTRDPARGATTLVRVALSDATLHTEHLGLQSTAPPAWWTALALSPTGRHAMLVGDTAASLHELPAGRAVGNCAVTPGWRATAIRFLGEDAARAWMVPLGSATGRLGDEIRVLDVAPGGCRALSLNVASATGAPSAAVLTADTTGSRLLVRHGNLTLRDGGTGAVLATLLEDGALSARFLGDGRIAAIAQGKAGSVLRVFTPQGTPLLSAELSREPAWLGPEIAPGRLVVALGWVGNPHGSVVVDTADGHVVQRLLDLTPALSRSWLGDYTPQPYGASAPRIAYFTDKEGHLVRFDSVTGQRRVVAGAGAPAGRRLH